MDDKCFLFQNNMHRPKQTKADHYQTLSCMLTNSEAIKQYSNAKLNHE